MSQLIERNDGVSFVCRTSRHSADTVKELYKELVTGAQADGALALVTSHEDAAIASVCDQQGYALGESVYHYLKHDRGVTAQNIIWCEELEDGEGDAAVVIVLDGLVEFDGIIPPAKIDSAVSAILAGATAGFELFFYGDVPIKAPDDDLDFGEDHKLELQENLVSSFTRIDDGSPTFQQLPALTDYAYKPLKTAFKRAGYSEISVITVIGVLAFLAAGSFIYEVYVSQLNQPPPAPKIVDNYKTLRSALQTPYPGQIIHFVHSEIDRFNHVDGLQLMSADYSDGQLEAMLRINGPALDESMRWLEKIGWTVEVGTGQIRATRPLHGVESRNQVYLEPTNKNLGVMTDDAVKAGIKLSLSKPTISSFTITPLTLTYEALSDAPSIYTALLVNNRPVVLDSIKVEPKDNGSNEYTVKLDLYGI